MIRYRFQEHTIVAVARRIETVLDFNRVAVFKDGELVEFDDLVVLIETD